MLQKQKAFFVLFFGILFFALLNIHIPAKAVIVSGAGVDISEAETFTSEIQVERDSQNNLRNLKYDIASTYSQAGIRYRTVAITVSIPGMDEQIIIPVKDLIQQFREELEASLGKDFRYGKTYYSTMCIYRDAIINNSSNPAKAAELLDKVTYIEVGAHIEIYKVETDDVLATLYTKEDVLGDTLARYGLQQHQKEILTRFKHLQLKYPDFSLIIDPGVGKENQIDSNSWWVEPGKTYNGKLYVYVQKEQGTASSVELENDYDFPVALKMLNSYIELKGDKFTPDENVPGVYRLRKVGEGEYTADFTYTVPKNMAEVKIWGVVNTTDYNIIPASVKFEPREANRENNAASVRLLVNLPDLTIQAAQRRYTGPPGGTVDIKPLVSNDNRENKSFATTITWRWKDEPNCWHYIKPDGSDTTDFTQVEVPAGTSNWKMFVPVPDKERRLIIAVNKEICDAPAWANPEAEKDIANNFDGATVAEAITPLAPPAGFEQTREPEEIVVAPEITCTDVYIDSFFTKPSGVRYTGDTTSVRAVVGRDNQGPATVQVKVTFKGDSGSKIETITLGRNDTRTVVLNVEHKKPGKETYTVTATPLNIEDCKPGNNSQQLQITVKAVSMPAPEPEKIGVELLS